MKIKVSDLRSFKANSGFIKQNNIIPVLSYLKFENGSVTKNNLNSFIIQSVGNSNESFLVDEKILMNFIDCTSESEIEIKLKDKRIHISDGNTKVTSPTDDLVNFPTNENEELEKTELDAEVLSAIKIASNFIMAEEGDMPVKAYVFVGGSLVAGSNGFIVYLEKFDKALPNFLLSKEIASSLGKYSSVSFSQSGNYYFLETDKIKLGFIKPNQGFVDFSPFSNFNKNVPSFVINKNEFIRFNDMAVSSTPIKGVPATFSVEKKKMKLDYNDTNYEINISKEIPAEGTMEGSFTFLPNNLNPLLKSVPDEILTFYQAKDRYYVTGDSGFVSFVTRMLDQTVINN